MRNADLRDSSLERLINDRERLVTDSEALQEILHLYVAIKRLDAIQPSFDAILRIVDEVIAIDLAAVEKAKQIVLAYRHLSARDAVHLAVMQQRGISRIFSFDSGFDTVPGVTRIF
jgi:predicted nucleic acid-binding protein